MNLKDSIFSAVLAATFVLMAAPASAVSHGGSVPATALRSDTRRSMDRMLTSEVQRVVDKQKRIAGQGKFVTATASLELDSAAVAVNLSKGYLPKSNGAAFEELRGEITNAVLEITEGTVRVQGVHFFIEGKPLEKYFPAEPRPALNPNPPKLGAKLEGGDVVLLAAGHGMYFNHEPPGSWRTQRETWNGVTEDFLTPTYQAELSTQFIARSNATVVNPRSTSSTVFPGTSYLWKMMAARYYIASLYPNNPELWHSLPSSTDTMREYDEDIRARPLFGNFVGATTQIHLHTNGGDTVSANGTRVYFQEGRTADEPLAANILCYMREQIHAQSSYANFNVAELPSFADKGEMRLSASPAVIVEVAFHTNPTDAAALKNTTFQKASMRGVEKGYRLNHEGKGCVPQQITAVAAASGPQYKDIPVVVDFKGYPRLPLLAEVKYTSCPSGWSCNSSNRVTAMISDTRLSYTVKCSPSAPRPTTTFNVTTVLIDADGVRTPAVQNSFTCTTPA